MEPYEKLSPAARCVLVLMELGGVPAQRLGHVTADALEELYQAKLILVRGDRVYLTTNGRIAWARLQDDFFLAQEWPCAG